MRDGAGRPPCRPERLHLPLRRGVRRRCLGALVPGLLVLVMGCHSATPAARAGLEVPRPDREVTRPVRPSTPPPVVFARAAWTDEPPIVSRLAPMGQPWRITLHHEGMDAHDLTSAQAVAERLRTITQAQKRPTWRGGLGAGDLAYHYCIDRAGRIWEGRSLAWQGAHAGNGAANAGNIGIVLLGNFELQQPTPAQLRGLRRLLLDLCQRYHVSRHNTYGHNEIKAQYGLPPTCCPGRPLSEWLDSFRAEHNEHPRAAR